MRQGKYLGHSLGEKEERVKQQFWHVVLLIDPYDRYSQRVSEMMFI